MAKTGKRLTKSYDNFVRHNFYEVDQAVTIAKENATAKFDESIEIAMNLGVDPRHADQMVRGVVALPHGTGKSVRVAVFARDAKAEEATAAGAERLQRRRRRRRQRQRQRQRRTDERGC